MLTLSALSGIRTHTERCLRPRSLPVGVPGLNFLTRERLPHGFVGLNRRLAMWNTVKMICLDWSEHRGESSAVT